MTFRDRTHAGEVLAVAYFDAHTVRPELEPLGRGVADMLTTDLGTAPGCGSSNANAWRRCSRS